MACIRYLRLSVFCMFGASCESPEHLRREHVRPPRPAELGERRWPMIASLSPAGVGLGVVEEVAAGVVRRLHALQRQVVLHLGVERHPRPERQHRHLDPGAPEPAVLHLCVIAPTLPTRSTGADRPDGDAAGGHQLPWPRRSVCSPKWKIDAASTASAPPSTIALDEVVERADAAARDHRDVDGVGDGAGQLEVEALAWCRRGPST